MTRTIQILRGTEAQNDVFTGAVGELTMDTTNNEIRIHDGSTVGGHKIANSAGVYTKTEVDTIANGKVDVGHQVIDFQEPTAANNYTWYRKYADGWVEQGGRKTTSGIITLPVAMADVNYNISMTQVAPGSAYAAEPFNITTTSFEYYQYQGAFNAFWQVSGMAA